MHSIFRLLHDGDDCPLSDHEGLPRLLDKRVAVVQRAGAGLAWCRAIKDLPGRLMTAIDGRDSTCSLSPGSHICTGFSGRSFQPCECSGPCSLHSPVRESPLPARRNASVGDADLLQNAIVSVWLYEQLSIRIEGKIRVSLSRATTAGKEYQVLTRVARDSTRS